MNRNRWSGLLTVICVLLAIIGSVSAQDPDPQDPNRVHAAVGLCKFKVFLPLVMRGYSDARSFDSKGVNAAICIPWPLVDYNGDGYGDLAVGVPGNTLEGIGAVGAVSIFFGSAGGLSTTSDQIWHQDSPGILGVAEDDDKFGQALAAGDFDGDGYTDLAVGVPEEDLDDPGPILYAGAVNVLYGRPDGLSAFGDQLWYQGHNGLEGTPSDHEWFGYALAAGDLNGDRYDDLAIGVPHEWVSGEFKAGAVHILYGSPFGMSANGSQFLNQDSPGVLGEAIGEELFGWALTIGDFDGDGYGDLAVGVPGDRNLDWSAIGAVNILYGSANGLSILGDQIWHQDSPDINGVGQHQDRFGWALVAGYFNDDAYADLAVGVPGENVGDIPDAGAVNILYGSPDGLSAEGNQLWDQSYSSIVDVAESGDEFGYALTSSDFDGDGRTDLAVGVPYEDVGLVADAGAVNVLYSSPGGLTGVDDDFWHQDVGNLADEVEEGDRYGSALAAGRFDDDAYADLAVGVPYERLGSLTDNGTVNVLYAYSTGGLSDVGNVLLRQHPLGSPLDIGDLLGWSLQ